MPDIVPPNVRTDAYTPLTAAQMGPAIDPAKGYRTENLGGGVYMVADGIYNTMFVVSDAGVILADAPPTLGAKTLRAIQDEAPGATIVTLDLQPRASRPHRLCGRGGQDQPRHADRRARRDAQDARFGNAGPTGADKDIQHAGRRLPDRGGQPDAAAALSRPQSRPGNIGIYHPGQKVLMLVDVVYPGG